MGFHDHVVFSQQFFWPKGVGGFSIATCPVECGSRVPVPPRLHNKVMPVMGIPGLKSDPKLVLKAVQDNKVVHNFE